MLDRNVRRIIDLEEVDVQFLPVPEDAQLVGVVDGYEYRPNLDVLGYVSLGKNQMGGTTKAPYGQAIQACEVTNTSARGILSLKLMEGEELIFEERADMPDRTIEFSSKNETSGDRPGES